MVARGNPKVDALLSPSRPWAAEMRALRKLMLETPLAEEIKWGWPCYQAEGRNIALIHAFKDYCALLFMKGALLADPQKLLIQQTENVRSPRQMRFTGLAEVQSRRAAILAYVQEAITVEQAGLKLPKAEPAETPSPPELEARFAASPELKAAFAALTPGRRRAYLLHFSGAKQEKTRFSRIDACAPRILAGKGLDD